MRKKSARFGKTNGRFFFALCVCVFRLSHPNQIHNKPQKGFEVSLFLWGPFLESKKREEEEEDAYLVAVEMKTSLEAHT